MLITDPLDLANKLAPAQETGVLALDTEFVWEKTYYPDLGLIQFATDANHCHLIDTLACKDLSALSLALQDDSIVKILHDAPQDLQIIHKASGVTPKNVFDTRQACGFIGLLSTQSLSSLLEILLGIKLEKGETRTNWLQRPLTPAQIVYAIDDVKHLPACRKAILDQLNPERLAWLKEDLSLLEQDHIFAEREPMDSWQRVKGYRKLRGDSAKALQAIAAWREHRARSDNKPRGHILKDPLCITIAQTLPDRPALRKLIGPADKYIGDDIMETLETARTLPAQQKTNDARIRETDDFKNAFKKCCTFFDAYCEEQKIDPGLVAVRKDIRSLLALAWYDQNNNGRLLTGWRKDLVGQLLLEKALELKTPSPPELF